MIRGAIHIQATTNVILSLLFLCAGCAKTQPPPLEIKHIVMVSLDTSRTDHFGFLGGLRARTPYLDSLATQSIVFSDFMTAAPTTLASHVSLFTGLYPHHHGTPRNGFMVNKDNVMLAEVLQAAGFHTAGFVGSFALESRFDFAQGFDHYDEEFSQLVGENGADQNQRKAGEVTDAVIAYLDKTEIPERLFLFVHYFDPHRPYAPPPPFDTMYDPRGVDDLPLLGPAVRSDVLTPQQKRDIARRHEMAYAGEISYMDHEIGRLLAYLNDRGITDNALIVVTSDHGENFRDHPSYYNHGFTVFQTTMHAVGMFRLPDARNGGTQVDGLVSSIDVLPTILHLVNMQDPTGIDGEMVDLLAIGDGFEPRTRFGEATKPWRDIESDPRWTNIRKARCVRQGRYKFIETPFQGTEEMYDLETDPDEIFNLLDLPSAETLAIMNTLRSELRAWTEAASPLPSEFDKAREEDTIKRLKSLGYID